MTEQSEDKELTQKLNQETAKIPWRELQRFFAAGNAVFIDESLDLIQTAKYFAADNSAELKPLTENQLVAPVSDQQASTWYEDDTLVWAVVIAPWVLVQRVMNKN